VYIKVEVKAGMKKESLVRRTKDSFVVSVKEPAERNMANVRVIELVAENFKVPVNKVRIINGHKHPKKLISIDLG